MSYFPESLENSSFTGRHFISKGISIHIIYLFKKNNQQKGVEQGSDFTYKHRQWAKFGLQTGPWFTNPGRNFSNKISRNSMSRNTKNLTFGRNFTHE